jgi:hypothetical protein
MIVVSSDVSKERSYYLARHNVLRKITDNHQENKTFHENVGGYVNIFLYLFDQQLIALHLRIWTSGGTVANLLLAGENLCVLGTLMFVLRRVLSCVNKKIT